MHTIYWSDTERGFMDGCKRRLDEIAQWSNTAEEVKHRKMFQLADEMMDGERPELIREIVAHVRENHPAALEYFKQAAHPYRHGITQEYLNA